MIEEETRYGGGDDGVLSYAAVAKRRRAGIWIWPRAMMAAEIGFVWS